MNRAEKAALQLRAVDVLRMLKETRTYDELAETTGLPAGDLNRYVNGHVLPGTERAREVVEELGRDALAAELDERIRVDHEATSITARPSSISLPRPRRAGRRERIRVRPPRCRPHRCDRRHHPRSLACELLRHSLCLREKTKRNRRRGVHRSPPAPPVRNRTYLLSACLRNRTRRNRPRRRRSHPLGRNTGTPPRYYRHRRRRGRWRLRPHCCRR